MPQDEREAIIKEGKVEEDAGVLEEGKKEERGDENEEEGQLKNINQWTKCIIFLCATTMLLLTTC